MFLQTPERSAPNSTQHPLWQVVHPLFVNTSGLIERLANWAGNKAKGYLRAVAAWTHSTRLKAMVAEVDQQIEDERRNRKYLESGYSENAAYTTSRAPTGRDRMQATTTGGFGGALKSFRGIVKMNISFFQVLSSFNVVYDIPWPPVSECV
jgi:hypothetical protein